MFTPSGGKEIGVERIRGRVISSLVLGILPYSHHKVASFHANIVENFATFFWKIKAKNKFIIVVNDV